MDNRTININILPQSSEAWFFIAIAMAIASLAWAMRGASPNAVEIAKVQAAAQVEIAKVQAGGK